MRVFDTVDTSQVQTNAGEYMQAPLAIGNPISRGKHAYHKLWNGIIRSLVIMYNISQAYDCFIPTLTTNYIGWLYGYTV